MTDSSATAVIFGGSSGIGESLATLLLRQGVKVVVADLQPPIKELPSYTFLPVDVCDRTAVKAVLQQSQPVDYCFNCAGILREGDSLSIPESDWDASLSVNLTGTINTSLEAYSIMAKQRHGHIVNLASSAALFPWPYMLPYVTSKYAVLGFTIGLRDEAACYGVSVSAVCPGNVATPMTGAKIDHFGSYTPAISADEAANQIMLGVRRNDSIIVFPGYARAFWRLERYMRGRSENLRNWYGHRAEIQLLPSFFKPRGAATDVLFKVVPEMFIPLSFGEHYILPITKWLAFRTRIEQLRRKLKRWTKQD